MRPPAELVQEDIDRLIIATFDRPEQHLAALPAARCAGGEVPHHPPAGVPDARAQARGERRADLRQFWWLLRTYLAPHWPAVALLLVRATSRAALTAAVSVLMAPILDLALGPGPSGAANASGEGLSLKTLGPAFFQWLGIGAVEDRFRAILWLAAAFFALGLVKGMVDFGNYMLGPLDPGAGRCGPPGRPLPPPPRPVAAFFTRHRPGSWSRVSTPIRTGPPAASRPSDHRAAAPLLIAAYGYLMVRTSPRLVGAALLAAAGPLRHDASARDPSAGSPTTSSLRLRIWSAASRRRS